MAQEGEQEGEGTWGTWTTPSGPGAAEQEKIFPLKKKYSSLFIGIEGTERHFHSVFGRSGFK